VLVGPADIGGKNSKNDAVIYLFTPWILHLGEIDRLHLDLSRPEINYTSICCHCVSPLRRRYQHAGGAMVGDRPPENDGTIT
jgi:hypothetical protein